MVRGLEIFREHFADYTDRYLLIGGMASLLVMNDAGLEFRATKALEGKDIRKHKNDVFRLYQLLVLDDRVALPGQIKEDMIRFCASIEQTGQVDLKNLGLKNTTTAEVVANLREIYGLTDSRLTEYPIAP